MNHVCATCGAEYGPDADYCNVCRTHSLVPVVPTPAPAPPKRPLREDANAVIIAAISWIVGLGYLVGHLEPREMTTLLIGWATLSAITIVVGLIVSNLRVFVVFSALGLLCCVIYAAVKLA